MGNPGIAIKGDGRQDTVDENEGLKNWTIMITAFTPGWTPVCSLWGCPGSAPGIGSVKGPISPDI